MTHVDDLYEPGDDREPEPDEQAVPPLDLDNLEKLYDLANEPGGPLAWRQVVYMEVPALIAELREARRRIAEFEALPTREEWAGTVSRNEPPEPGKTVFYRDVETAEKDTATNAAQLWRRMLSAHPWEPIDSKPPF
ncbi:hypothetical protein ACIBK9_47425 [Nonomuraea sp. NPDC050227]|uniref:hypothetical protein n=1 Tax=Nonomuraea sp. NPDC050227 TaxID=3364360 RepID=UPI00379152AE